MKKLLFSFAAFLSCICTTVNAQTISVNDVVVLPGTTGSFTLNLQGGQDNKYISLQFNATFPKTGFKTLSKNDISPLWVGASATIGDIDADGLAIIPMSSDTELSTGNVEGLLTVYFEVADNVAEGTYPVKLSKITFGYGVSDKDVAQDVTFNVKVVNQLTLDEMSTIAPTATGKAVNILVKRTIKANTWSTICLPFDMTTEQWQTAFGSDAKLHRLSGYKKVNDAIKVIFKDALSGKFLANKPYVIRTSKDISEFEVTAEVKPTSGKEPILNEDEDEIAYAQGVYKAETAVPEDNVFVSGGSFYYSDGAIKSKAYRAYFWFADKAATSRVIMSFENETTGIKDLNAGDSDKVFDLQGRSVKTPAKGVYIKGGKKVMVK